MSHFSKENTSTTPRSTKSFKTSAMLAAMPKTTTAASSKNFNFKTLLSSNLSTSNDKKVSTSITEDVSGKPKISKTSSHNKLPPSSALSNSNFKQIKYPFKKPNNDPAGMNSGAAASPSHAKYFDKSNGFTFGNTEQTRTAPVAQKSTNSLTGSSPRNSYTPTEKIQTKPTKNEERTKTESNDDTPKSSARKTQIGMGKKLKNLEIDIPETESYSPQKKMIPFKSLSTRHAGPTDALSFEAKGLAMRQQQQKVMTPSNTSLNQGSHGFSSQQQVTQAPINLTSGTFPLQPAHRIILPHHEPTKCSLKRNGIVRAYAANTNQGLVRNYNEDRVSIILNILKPPNRENETWPKCSFFGVYDGHGGASCADYLRDNLHQFVIKEASFPWNPKEALRSGFAKAEKKFLELAETPEEIVDRSGSCAIVVLIVGDTCYVANVGDSRAVLSGEGGKRIFPLSRDHKPTDENERKRIIDNGGQIYQTATTTPKAATGANGSIQREVIVGPHRVLPGRLSVSRTFGDAEAKIAKFGGNPEVVVAVPEIKSFKIAKDHDFIILASDGIFDKLSNKDSIQCVWNSVNDGIASNIHQQAGLGVEYVLKNSLLRRTLDNVTVVMIAFSNFKRMVEEESEKKKKSTETAENQQQNEEEKSSN